MSEEKPSAGGEKPAPQAPPSPANQPQNPPTPIGSGTFGLDPRASITIVTPVEKKNC